MAQDLLFLTLLAFLFTSVRLFLDQYVFEIKIKGTIFLCWWILCLLHLALVFWETRRSDFWVSMAHHIATVTLILLSYMLRFARVGSVILALHEGCDVFLEMRKMLKYSGYNGIARFFFVAFVLSFTILRLIFFPFWILWSTCYEVVLVLDLDSENNLVTCSVSYYLFNSLLFSSLICHVYWWLLMVQILINQIKIQKVKNMKIDHWSIQFHHFDGIVGFLILGCTLSCLPLFLSPRRCAS